MLVLGVILVLIAVLLVLGAVVGGADDPAAFSLGSLHMSGLNVTTVFLLGALSLLLLVAGVALLRMSARRATARRRQAKETARMSARLHEYEAKQEEPDEPQHRDESRPESG